MLRVEKRTLDAELISHVNTNDADADFVQALHSGSDAIYAVNRDATTIGFAQILLSNTAFLYVYVFPENRARGYGDQAVSACEGIIRANGARSIVACYRLDCSTGAHLSAKHDYSIQYASHYMEYTGAAFPDDDMSVRQYLDSDYLQAHALYAEAFHLMRLESGSFPDSTQEKPSDRMKQHWAGTADERFVFIDHGQIIGYAHIDGREIASLAIKRECQGKGFGRKFVKHMTNLLYARGFDKVSLCCVVGNDRAYALYESLGFTTVYDAIYVRKKLID